MKCFVYPSVCLATMMAAVPAWAQSSFDLTYNQPGLGSMVYRVYLPENYQSSGPDKTPVVLYLHSAAERGNNVDEVFVNPHGQSGNWVNPWINYLVNETQTGNNQAILIIPQSGLGQVWNSMTAGDNWGVGNYSNTTQKPIGSRLQLAVNILDNALSTYNADTNRVYVTGASMGGYGTWDAIARFPEKFAAAMPVAGAGNRDSALQAFDDVPVWAYHGATDSLIPASNSDQLYFAMKQAGADPLYSRAANQGHAGFDLFYNPGYYTTNSQATPGGSGQSVYDWLFSQSLDNRPALTPPMASKTFLFDVTGTNNSNSASDYLADGSELVGFNKIRNAGSVTECRHLDGSSSTVSITYVSGSAGAVNSNAAGLLGADLKNKFTDGASRDFLGTSGSGKLVWRIDGLDDDKTYDFEFFSSRTTSSTRLMTRIELVGLELVVGEINSANNFNTLLDLHDVRSLNGSITMTLMAGTGYSGFTYLNSFRMTEVAIPEPASLGLLLMTGAVMLRARR